jgi:hypothetical protein
VRRARQDMYFKRVRLRCFKKLKVKLLRYCVIGGILSFCLLINLFVSHLIQTNRFIYLIVFFFCTCTNSITLSTCKDHALIMRTADRLNTY